MATSTTQIQGYFAKVPFTYCGRDLERGEFTNLRGAMRDQQLVGLGYFIMHDPKTHPLKKCDMCSKIFAGEQYYVAHKRKGCKSPSSPITRSETAELLGVDPSRVTTE